MARLNLKNWLVKLVDMFSTKGSEHDPKLRADRETDLYVTHNDLTRHR